MAAEYLVVMDILGVEVGLAKSLVSEKSLVGEFAKRFFIPRDASMIPYKEVIASRFNLSESLQFIHKYGLRPVQALSFMGMGYRVKGRINSPFRELNSRARNLLLMSLHPSGPWGVS